MIQKNLTSKFKHLPLIIGLSILSIAGCSTNTLPPASQTASKTTNVESYKYLIGPGDNVSIFVWRNPEVSGSFIVRPDGMITTSLVEDIPVAGKTSTELAREVEKVLSTYIREPVVTVSVTTFNGPYSEQVRVIGEAANPQSINYKQNMTLLDLMIAVGGLTEFADGNDAVLVRVINGQQKEFVVKLDSLIKDGDISANVDMLPGDIIIIPEAWF